MTKFALTKGANVRMLVCRDNCGCIRTQFRLLIERNRPTAENIQATLCTRIVPERTSTVK